MKPQEPTDLSGNTPSQYRRWGVEPSSHLEHEFDPSQLIPMEASRWWMTGNELHADTNHGELVQRIPTDYILVGEKDGLPVFRKIGENTDEND